ncbi:hypothetical protein CsatB_023232 [Cannabis sativa]
MDPFLHKMKSAMQLSDAEKTVVAITDDGNDGLAEELPSPDFSLFARVITNKKVWLSTFQRQMAQHWDGRFKVNIKEHYSGLFILCFGCEGDRFRALEKEPWHFQDHHIVLYPPMAMHNVTPEAMIYSPFWVQAYRLPFLSKSKSLARSLGNLLGEFISVHEDSLNEGWGSFLRFRVRLDITKPLLRGKMITLPRVKDEFWVEFRYERLPEYCMECGLIGHLYQKCPVFLEQLDNGVDPELPYGPTLIGSALPSSSYDRYRSDFSKGNAWPLLTRLARTSLTASIPQLQHRPAAHPRPLLIDESSNTGNMVTNSTRVLPSTNIAITSPEVPHPFSPGFLTQSTLIPPKHDINNFPSDQLFPHTSYATSKPLSTSTITATHLSDVYTPDQSPQVLFLMETKLCDGALSRFKNLLNFSNGLEVARVGLKGGLMLLWQDVVDVTLLSMNTNNFDCYILFDDGPRWHFSALYGFPEAVNKKHTWKLIRRLADVSPLDPWLLIGDINEIFSNEHKNGGPLRDDNQMQAFRTTLDQCFLTEIPAVGDEFTWARNRKSASSLKERLDWCFINHVWRDNFVWPKLSHLDYYGSDHRVLLAEIDFNLTPPAQAPRKTRFRFEQFWLKDKECYEIISNSWLHSSETDPASRLVSSLRVCANNLHDWHYRKFGKMKQDIKLAQKTVHGLNTSASSDPDFSAKVHSAESILDELLANEEQYWQQRSRVDWLQSGDRNTKFFHSKASARHSNNRIKALTDDHGNTVTTKEGISRVVADYFQELFTASNEDHWALSHVLSTIPTTISDEQNDFLCQDFTASEVFTALKTIGSDKSPGLDGMSAMFYHHNWNIVGELVTQVALDVLNNGTNPESFNKTLITLIPKIKKPKTMKDFRPISLCNVTYKIISKMLALRFKEVLHSVISETQSAFLSNRLITDNILVAFEMVHSLKHRTRGSKGFAALKLDMSKAFDRVEWSFLAAVMGKMGFGIKCISLIMTCLHTNSFSFLINGEVSGSVIPQRGLRQGDPLSPYLFLICSEGLSRLLQHEEQIGRLQGLAVSRHSPSITHLLFADDSLLFCQANDRSCGSIKRALDVYHRASGQLLNTDKSVMSFSPNTPEAVKLSFQQILGMPICACHESYLGLPAYSERDKSQLFNNIKERIWKLMHAWSDKIFSIGGKEVLLKAVVQAIPTYAMSCFRLSAKFCKQIETMMARFWWGSSTDNKKIHWKNWKSLCTSKRDGGLGFRSFVHFNQAFLAKQAWRIFQTPNSLLSRVLKGRYYHQNDFMTAKVSGLSSLTWQGIVWGRELLSKGLIIKIGDGTGVNCAHDSWIPGNEYFKPLRFTGSCSNLVADYITDTREWDLELLHNDFSPADIDRILTIPLSYNSTRDRWRWHYDSSGDYTVKSGYNLACSLENKDHSSSSTSQEAWWQLFWGLNLPSKVRIFGWRVINSALPVAQNLFHRKVITSATCSLCSRAWESIGHALFSCCHAKSVWQHTSFQLDFTKASFMKDGDYLLFLSTILTKSELEKLFCTMWFIWSDRNNYIHCKQLKHPMAISSQAEAYLANFHSVKSATAPAVSCVAADARTVKWVPPTESNLKMNVDAALDSSRNKIGIGVIIRDSTGRVIAAMSKPVVGNFKSQEMEAKAMFWGLQWAKQLQLQPHCVETDCLMLVHALQGKQSQLSSFHDLVEDISYHLSSFSNACISHVRRDANQAAHGLAKQALQLDNDCIWIEEIPSTIFSVVVNDTL